jgi:hypothetical protein
MIDFLERFGSGQVDLHGNSKLSQNIATVDSIGIIKTRLNQVKTLIHFKGFASGIKTSPTQEMIEMISRSDALLFDGDNYNIESYTQAIRLAVEKAISDKRNIPIIIAFRYDKTEEEFKKSWENINVNIICYKVKQEEVQNFYFNPPIQILIGKNTTKENISNKKIATFTTPTKDQEKYAALGLFAMNFTGSLETERTVVAWGGSDTVLYEFEAGKRKFDGKASKWIYFDVTREKANGDKEQGRLSEIEDELLEKRYILNTQ